MTEQALTSISDYLETQSTTKSSKFLAEASFLREGSRAGSSVWHERRLRKAEAAGSNPARSILREPGSFSVKEGIFRTVWELRNRGYADLTIQGYAGKLRTLSRLGNLNTPESVRSLIAKKCSNAFKEALVNAYDQYAKVNGLSWKKRACGNYDNVSILRMISEIISDLGYQLILALEFDVPPSQVHDYDLLLLHNCRYAIFEITMPNGHLMELERAKEYVVQTLAVYQARDESRKPPPTVTSMILPMKIPKYGYLVFDDLNVCISEFLPSRDITD
jgi:hypothetical protein